MQSRPSPTRLSFDLQRTSYNMMIYEVCDYSCTLLDTAGTLMSQNIGGVSHFIADMGVVIQGRHRAAWLGQLRPRRCPHHQSSGGGGPASQQYRHLHAVLPRWRAHGVFPRRPCPLGGRRRLLSTGFGALGSTDPWSEGLQLNQLKIYEAGKPDKKLLSVISDNIRFPQAAMGDLRSQIAACRLAERRLEELYKRYGADTIAAAMEIIYSEAERKCRAVVETIPDGVYEADNYVDAPGAKEPLVHIHVKVTVSGSDMEIDFTGTQPQTGGQQQLPDAGGGLHRLQGLTTPLEPANEARSAP